MTSKWQASKRRQKQFYTKQHYDDQADPDKAIDDKNGFCMDLRTQHAQAKGSYEMRIN